MWAIVYGPGVGREKTITVAEPGDALQKNVALPEVAATYCLPAARYVTTPPFIAPPVLKR